MNGNEVNNIEAQAFLVEVLFHRANKITANDPGDDALDIIAEAMMENEKLHIMCSRLHASVYRARAWKQIHA